MALLFNDETIAIAVAEPDLGPVHTQDLYGIGFLPGSEDTLERPALEGELVSQERGGRDAVHFQDGAGRRRDDGEAELRGS